MLYMRKYRLSIETWRGDVIEIPDLRFTFHIEKRINESLWFGEVTIYNLSPDTETDIFKNGKTVLLEAGYENGPYGLLFKGPVRQPIRGKEDGTTYFLKLICVNDILNLGFCNLTLTQGQDAESIMNQIARSASIPFDIRIGPGLSKQKTERGKVIFGNAEEHLRSIAQNNNGFIYVDDAGVVNYSSLSVGPPAVVPTLNSQTGLIGIPQQVDLGIQFRCLINPTIRLDSWVHINNRDIVQAEIPLFGLQTLLDLDGIYRVIEIVASGDTRGNDWYFDVNAISQAGSVPAMLTLPNQNGV